MSRGAHSLAWIAVLVSLVVLAIAVAALSGRPADRDAASGESPSTKAPHETHVEASAPTDPELGREDLETPATDPNSGGKPHRSRPAWAQVVLVGTLRAPSAAVEDVTLLVRPGANEREQRGASAARSAWGKSGADGAFRIDVSAAFPRGADSFPTKLTLQAVRDGALPTEVEVDVPFGADALTRGGTLEIPAAIVLCATCRLSGTAWVVGDEAATVEVAAFALVDGAPALQPSATSSGHTARIPFELALECDRDYAVIAFLDGYRPTTRIVHANAFGSIELPLEHGATVSGRAQLGTRPIEGTVLAQIEGAPDPQQAPSVNGTSFAWIAGAFEWNSVSARTHAEGQFELHGLAPAPYELRLVGVTGVYSKDTARTRIEAPAEGVELAPRVCELVIELSTGGAPAANTLLSIQETTADGGARMGSTRTDAQGRATIWAEPGSSLKITASQDHVLTCGAVGPGEVVKLVE